MASEDPAVLKAFLQTYPKSTSAPQVRDRLRHLEPQKVWPISRNAVFVGLGVLAASGLLLLLHFAVRTPPTQILRDQKSDNPAPLPRAVDTARAPEEDMGRFVSRVFGSTELQWKQIFAEAGQTYRAPELVLYRGAKQANCGEVAQSAMGPFYCPADQKVYLDTSLFFDQIATRFRGCDRTCQFSQAYVIAHEVGHHVQNLLGVLPKVQEMQKSMDRTDSNSIQVRVELQADCLAGVWANRESEYLKSQNKPPIIDAGDVDAALRAVTAIAEDTLQRKAQVNVVPDSFTQGSAEQRQRWFNTGFRSGSIASCNTFGAAQL